jgi:prepilin-type N-terminal cleavage/methylation domain-containing protein
MRGGKQKQPLGYTIIEVMIVLAVSGVMFIIAAQFINGRQEKTSFTAGVNAMASEINDVIEQVNDGRYTDIPLNCDTLGGHAVASQDTDLPVNTNKQGTNQQCIFRGKMMHFYGSPTNSYDIISFADSRQNFLPETTSVHSTVEGVKDITVQSAIPQGLYVYKFYIEDSSGALNSTPDNNIMFLQSPGNYDPGTQSYASGAQSLELAYKDVGYADSLSGFENSITGGANMPFTNAAAICLSDGHQYAMLKIGDPTTNSSQLTVNVTMKGTTACV